jgi:multiple sugar transport system substrate-binding protein
MRLVRIGLCALMLSLASCAGLPLAVSPTLSPVPSPPATLSPTLPPQVTSTPAQPAVVHLWLPPQFDPGVNSKAGTLLNLRLQEFSKRRSGVRIEVRIKALEGPGGLLESLAAANAAAPLALPDLVLLPRSVLETAALKGLLSSLDEKETPLSAEDWYPYAQQLARVQNSIFGIPLAGDALVLLYRPAALPLPPSDWAAALALAQPLIFPAADGQALFTLAQYLSTGIQLQDSEGRPTLDAEALTQVLTFYKDGEAAGLLPFWLTQYSTDEQSWQAFSEGNAHLVVSWSSRYLAAALATPTATPSGLEAAKPDLAAAPIPTVTGTPFTLATGWVLAISTPQVERQPLSLELAQFLTTSDFLSLWTASAGYLPARTGALSGWSDPHTRALLDQVANSAQVSPPADLLLAISPALQQATVEVLKEQADPAVAAQEAEDQVTGR